MLIAESRNFELLRAHLKRVLTVVAIKPGNKKKRIKHEIIIVDSDLDSKIIIRIFNTRVFSLGKFGS